MNDLEPSDLLKGFDAWCKVALSIRQSDNVHLKAWLRQWESWDMACSPLDDNERRFIRYGHYWGWCDAERARVRQP